MAMTEEQRDRLIEIVDRMSEQEVDTVLSSMHNFVDFLYYKARDIYESTKHLLNKVWNWIKNIFS